MARTLDVYLHSDPIGHLIQGDGGDMVFDYAESWLNKPGATPLSQSLPLTHLLHFARQSVCNLLTPRKALSSSAKS
jgi:HipA-like protein